MATIDGYEISKTILFETGHGLALGCMTDMPDNFAVWHFTQTEFGRDYYWCSRITGRSVAEEVLKRKADCYRESYGVEEMTEHSAGKYYRYYSTQRPIDIATYPEPEGNRPLVIVNYNDDRRRPVAGGKLYAWGELVYTHPLTKKQIEDYELKPAPIAAVK